MNHDDKEYLQAISLTLIGWRLSGANAAMAQHIATRMIVENKESVRITTEDFIYATHYSRAMIVKSIRYLVDRSIILRTLDVTDNKGYLYSVVIYDMQDKEKVEGIMNAYKKNGNGYGSWNSKDDESKKKVFCTKYLGVDVDDWTYDDFAFFLQDFIKYSAKNVWNFDMSGVNLILNSSFRRNQTFVNMVDYLNTHSGDNFCKLLLKAYLQWATENIFKGIVTNEIKPVEGIKQFSLGHFCQKSYMQEFLDEHDITEDMKSATGVEGKLAHYRRIVEKKAEKTRSVHSITLKDMKEYYSHGISTLLTECGVVLTGNYLVEFENKTLQEAADEMGNFMKDLNVSHARQKKALKQIVDRTCVGSPYYKTMDFLNWYNIYKDIFKQLGKQFDKSGFQITRSKKRNSYTFFRDKEMVKV